MDMKITFLNEDLEYEFYMEQNEGFTINPKKEKCIN